MPLLHSKNRLEAFSDSVFAFAATLLVVSLEVPQDFTALQTELDGFWGFGISFFSLILIWKTHYNFFRRSETIDNWIIAANMLMLLVILYFVYPLKFLVNLFTEGGKITPNGLAELFSYYGLGFSVLFACLAFMYWWSGKKIEGNENEVELNFYARHFTIFVLVGILSIGIAYGQWGIRFGLPGFVYILLGPLCYWHGRRTRLTDA